MYMCTYICILIHGIIVHIHIVHTPQFPRQRRCYCYSVQQFCSPATGAAAVARCALHRTLHAAAAVADAAADDAAAAAAAAKIHIYIYMYVHICLCVFFSYK